MAGQRVVLSEVTRLCATFGNGLPELFRGLFGYVLIEPTRARASEQYALDGGVFEGAVGEGVRECSEQVGGVITFAQSQNLAPVVTG